jgi:hypothetical protein
MKTNLLFPNRFKIIGWVLLIPSTILGIAVFFFDVEFDFLKFKVFAIYSEPLLGKDTVMGFTKINITLTITGLLFLIGALFVAFSKEKHEDEFIAKTRLESLVWATYINYAILIFCLLFIYELAFLYVLVGNMFTILIFFILRFYYILYKTNKSLKNEK